MMFAHIRQKKSLRDLDIALNAHATKLYYIGIQQCPKSTFADANERRDYRIHEDFAKALMQQARREYANTQLSINVDNAIYALDASVIDLTLSVFPWAKFRKKKGAIKLHAMIDLRGNIPAFFLSQMENYTMLKRLHKPSVSIWLTQRGRTILRNPNYMIFAFPS